MLSQSSLLLTTSRFFSFHQLIDLGFLSDITIAKYACRYPRIHLLHQPFLLSIPSKYTLGYSYKMFIFNFLIAHEFPVVFTINGISVCLLHKVRIPGLVRLKFKDFHLPIPIMGLRTAINPITYLRQNESAFFLLELSTLKPLT